MDTTAQGTTTRAARRRNENFLHSRPYDVLIQLTCTLHTVLAAWVASTAVAGVGEGEAVHVGAVALRAPSGPGKTGAPAGSVLPTAAGEGVAAAGVVRALEGVFLRRRLTRSPAGRPEGGAAPAAAAAVAAAESGSDGEEAPLGACVCSAFAPPQARESADDETTVRTS